MTSWVSRLLPRNGRSLATASENQRAEDRHRHQEAYGYFLPIQTRWQDNDQYGHVNNVVYYSYFDTIINQYLISQQCLFPAHLAPDVLSATTVCPASSKWQNAKSPATFTWKRFALNSCSPLIALPASAAWCLHRINCLSIRFSHDFD